MTFRDRVAEIEPRKIRQSYNGGVEGCPMEYDFLNSDDEKCIEICRDSNSLETCEDCWNQEYIAEK